MRQKDLRIANLMVQVTNETLEIPSNLKKRSSICGSMKIRPKTHNPQQMPNLYRN